MTAALKRVLAALFLLLNASALYAQSVQQSGHVTATHAASWVTNGVIGDGGTAADSPITTLGVTSNTTAGFCVSSGRVTAAGRQQLCLGAPLNSAAVISVQNYGTATAQGLSFVINGNTVTIPSSGSGAIPTVTLPLVDNNTICADGTGGVLKNCGLTIISGVVTAGTWQGTAIAVANGGTGATTASSARTNLGLGTLAVQNAGAVAITGGTITGLPLPTATTDAANKQYVDSLATGLNILAPSTLATAAVLPNSPTYDNGTLGVGATLTAGSNTTLTVDGTTANLADVVLVKTQADATQNGIYSVTQAGDGSNPWILTRVTYFDEAAEMLAGSYTYVSAGATNIGSAWTLGATVTTVGSDDLSWNLFSQVTSISIGSVTGLGTGVATALGNAANATGGFATYVIGSASAFGLVKCDGTTITCTAGVIASVGGGVTSFEGKTGVVTASAANKVQFVSAAGSDSSNGQSWQSAKLTIGAAMTAAGTGGTINVGAGTYTLTAELAPSAKMALNCAPGATITQGSAQNLTRLVDFNTNSANGASITGCTVDGNRANNTDNPGNVVLVYIGGANDVTVKNNTVQNSNGDGISFTTGLRPIIKENKITNIVSAAIFALTTGLVDSQYLISDNYITAPIGETAIQVIGVDHGIISNNHIKGSFIGGSQNPMVASLSGTTLTWNSGPNFTDVYPGMFWIANGGAEYFITAKASTTSLTVSASGSLSSKTGAIGTGDLISVQNSRYTTVIGNEVANGVSLGISVANTILTTADTAFTLITGNNISYIGAAPISLQTVANGTSNVGTNISGNTIYRPGVNSAGNNAGILVGIYIIGGNTVDTLVSNNFIFDDLGNMQYKLAEASTTNTAGWGNYGFGAANSGVFGTITALSGVAN